jgi:hypothetical protein
MKNENKSVADQWGVTADATEPPKKITIDTELITPAPEPATPPLDANLSEAMKRRGFFEAISHIECPMQRLAALLNEYKQEATDRLNEADQFAGKRIEHLNTRIAGCKDRIAELKEKITVAEQYKESADVDLQELIKEKLKQEAELLELQNRITDIRIQLGEAKSGIISKSLKEADEQVKKALDIQKTIYDETRSLNQKKFNDEKDHLARLSKCYQELFDSYEKRYKKVNKYISVLDIDSINPITTRVLTTIGTISFGAAGFFFSTFAGTAGFGNQDMLYFIFSGLIDTANKPLNGFLKILILLALILLVTGISWLCNLLIRWLKANGEEDVLSEVVLAGGIARKFKQLQYQARIKSNNWYAFWLQLVPAILIAGLLILCIAGQVKNPDIINSINASSEGMIVGTCIAMSFAGLIYLYIIKIVEPRLVRKYDANPDVHVNWVKANWELVTILICFLVFSICIIAIPYDKTTTGLSIISVDQRTRYAILLFIAVCLMGSISFAYSVRGHGLIKTSNYLERVMQQLIDWIAYCSSAEAPDLHNKVAEEHGNIMNHVLKQFTYKAQAADYDTKVERKKGRPKSFFEKIKDLVKWSKKEVKPAIAEEAEPIIEVAPWEEKYFPHITDELKAVEFEYREKRAKVKKAEEDIDDYKVAKITELRKYKNEEEECLHDMEEYEDLIEATIKERSKRFQRIRTEYTIKTSELQDGFHLGMWYRENGMGPTPGYFAPCLPNGPLPLTLIASQS